MKGSGDEVPGPHVQLAALCERVLTETDGVISLIRILDRITIAAHGQNLPSELPEGKLQTTMVIALKSDDAQGRHSVIIRTQEPSGRYLPDQSVDAMFEGGVRGVNIVSTVTLDAMEGTYWFDVLVNDQLKTRIPLQVIYQRVLGP